MAAQALTAMAISTMLALLKPAIASPTVMTPVKGSATSIIMATASERGDAEQDKHFDQAGIHAVFR